MYRPTILTEFVMANTFKDKAKVLKRISRKLLVLPANKVVPDKKKTYKRKPKNRKADYE